jgi:hypothetical protein
MLCCSSEMVVRYSRELMLCCSSEMVVCYSSDMVALFYLPFVTVLEDLWPCGPAFLRVVQ